MINRMLAVLIGIVVIALGAAVLVGLFTQTTTMDTKTKMSVTTPGVLPVVIPAVLFGISTMLIAGIIVAIGLAVIVFGWQFGY